jgi:hypothetical protein
MKTIKRNNYLRGQALISLLIFSIIAITISSAAVILTLNTATTFGARYDSSQAYAYAETGIENALIRLLRDPGYAGEVLSINSSEIDITVVNTSNSYEITSSARYRDYVRTIVVDASLNNGILNITSWRELN